MNNNTRYTVEPLILNVKKYHGSFGKENPARIIQKHLKERVTIELRKGGTNIEQIICQIVG